MVQQLVHEHAECRESGAAGHRALPASYDARERFASAPGPRRDSATHAPERARKLPVKQPAVAELVESCCARTCTRRRRVRPRRFLRFAPVRRTRLFDHALGAGVERAHLAEALGVRPALGARVERRLANDLPPRDLLARRRLRRLRSPARRERRARIARACIALPRVRAAASLAAAAQRTVEPWLARLAPAQTLP